MTERHCYITAQEQTPTKDTKLFELCSPLGSVCSSVQACCHCEPSWHGTSHWKQWVSERGGAVVALCLRAFKVPPAPQNYKDPPSGVLNSKSQVWAICFPPASFGCVLPVFQSDIKGLVQTWWSWCSRWKYTQLDLAGRLRVSAGDDFSFNSHQLGFSVWLLILLACLFCTCLPSPQIKTPSKVCRYLIHS